MNDKLNINETKMKVRELIEELSNYNQEAEFEIVVGDNPEKFEICYGNSEGCTKSKCDVVSIFVNSKKERKR